MKFALTLLGMVAAVKDEGLVELDADFDYISIPTWKPPTVSFTDVLGACGIRIALMVHPPS